MRIRHSGGCLTPWLLLFLLAASSSNADNLGESFLLFSGGGRPLIIIVGFDDRLVVLSRYRPAERTEKKKEFLLLLLHCYVIGSSADVGSDFDGELLSTDNEAFPIARASSASYARSPLILHPESILLLLILGDSA